MKNPFQGIAESFILTVGITPPTPEKERAATIFISAMLFGTILFALAVGVFILRRII
ncbi:hypothetical protein [Granulicella sibirica]|uniref:Uncharacterized protein n=1 Tax=Granulicella sibirica TaxID=2479048 RepID=A0A4Q0T0H4_9BACT|nr:hypothetical protein [Granulicella sibirica]RXH54991.1 hypothetical protein GRAN_4095 [Granulicella sibirica]